MAPRTKGVHWSSDLDDVTREAIDMMLDGKWITGRSHLDLAKKHGRDEGQVRQIAANASRFIRLCRGKEDQVRERILLAIDRGERLALEAEKVAFSMDGQELRAKQPDLRALIAFLQLQCEVHGLCRSAKDKPTDDDTVKLPINELRELLDGLGFEVVKKDGSSSDEEDGTTGE